MIRVTQAQKEKIAMYEDQVEKNMVEYEGFGSKGICSCGIYYNPEKGDENVTLIITTISGISESLEPYIATNNIMIEPNGNSFKLTDVYPKDYVYEYIKKLIKAN